jgi:uncharacterized protein YPO0396
MSERCKKHVFSNRRDDFRGHQCGNKAKKDGLCTIHQPEYIAERSRKAQEAYNLKWENTPIKKANRRIAEQAATIERLTAEISEYQTLVKRLVTDTTSRWALDQLISKALEQTP